MVEQKYKTFIDENVGKIIEDDNATQIHNDMEHIDIKLEPCVDQSRECRRNSTATDASDCDMNLSDPVCEQTQEIEDNNSSSEGCKL